MHIFLLNWRDIKHPRMGGAEVLTHGIFSRLVQRGHRVTWYASSFPGSSSHEFIDGIDIHRGGNAVTVRAAAFAFYRHANDVDVVVDEINTLPFFTPLYARAPVVAFICQLAREVWFYEAPPVVAQIGYSLERLYLRPYRHTSTLTISESSAESLRSEAALRGSIGVMPMAIDQYSAGPPLPLSQRDETIVVLGRVTPSKRIDHTIRAISLLPERFSRLRLQIVGGGSPDVRNSLDRLAGELGVRDRIEWSGFLTEAEKRDRLRKARAVVMNSVREGWGLAVSEANLAGTPAVGYRIPGLRDSIRDGKTGLLTGQSPEELARGLAELLTDEARYADFARAAQDFAHTLTWDRTTAYTERFLEESINKG